MHKRKNQIINGIKQHLMPCLVNDVLPEHQLKISKSHMVHSVKILALIRCTCTYTCNLLN